MREEFNVEEIQGGYRDGRLGMNTTLEMLLTCIENSSNEVEREKSLEAIKKLNLQSEQLRKILEDLLISDSNGGVRRVAAELLVRNYLEQSLEVLKWVLENESLVECLCVVLDGLKLKKKDMLRNFLKGFFKSLIGSMKPPRNGTEAHYIANLEELFRTKAVEEFSMEELLAIFINFKVIMGLEQKYRLEKHYCVFSLKDCLVDELELVGLGIKEIKEVEGLDKLTSLEDLNLDGNKITEISGLELLTSLRVLILSHNSITEIKGLSTLKNLSHLDLGHNKIEEIKGLDKLVKLLFLNLEENQIKKIQGLKNLRNLLELCLFHNQISEIRGLKTLKELRFTSLDFNHIRKLKGIKGLKKLGDIGLSQNPIKVTKKVKKLRDSEKLFFDEYVLTTEEFAIMLERCKPYITDEKIKETIERYKQNLEKEK